MSVSPDFREATVARTLLPNVLAWTSLVRSASETGVKLRHATNAAGPRVESNGRRTLWGGYSLIKCMCRDDRTGPHSEHGDSGYGGIVPVEIESGRDSTLVWIGFEHGHRIAVGTAGSGTSGDVAAHPQTLASTRRLSQAVLRHVGRHAHSALPPTRRGGLDCTLGGPHSCRTGSRRMSDDTPGAALVPRTDRAAVTKAIQRVLRRLADGESMRAACRAEGVSRHLALRRIERSPPLQQQYAFSVAAQAHGKHPDELLSIADGTDDADTFAQQVASAVAGIVSQHVESVVKGLAVQRVQRDRLRFDARRWLSSRLLPAVYGGQQRATVPGQVQVNVVFDGTERPSKQEASLEISDSGDYEILETN